MYFIQTLWSSYNRFCVCDYKEERSDEITKDKGLTEYVVIYDGVEAEIRKSQTFSCDLFVSRDDPLMS